MSLEKLLKQKFLTSINLYALHKDVAWGKNYRNFATEEAPVGCYVSEVINVKRSVIYEDGDMLIWDLLILPLKKKLLLVVGSVS